MDYGNKEHYFKNNGSIGTEIAAIMMLAMFVMLCVAGFYAYKKVESIYEDKAEILARLEKFEDQLGGIQRGDDIRRISDEHKKIWQQLADLAERADGPVGGELKNQLKDLQLAVVKLEKRIQSEGVPGQVVDPVIVAETDRIKLVKDIKVTLVRCANKMEYFFCDVQLTNTGRSGRMIEISNENTLVRDNSGKDYRGSSFTFGFKDGEEMQYKSDAFLSKGLPFKLRFRFFDPPADISAYASVQFNIDGIAVPFEKVLSEN
jgi:hypothetical protein